MLVGVDFDNTIVCYDQVLYQSAFELGLIPADIPVLKDEIRGYIHEHHGADKWTEIQGVVYGLRIHDAHPFPGVLEFLTCCKRKGIQIRIISHKTEYPVISSKLINLRTAALEWMEAMNFFDGEEPYLSHDDVLFGATRQEKIEHIRNSDCTYFIDDLEEVFLVETFPNHIKKILFSPGKRSIAIPGITIVKHWYGMCEYFFGKTV